MSEREVVMPVTLGEAVADPRLCPPWIVFYDNDKPVAILPAGRPGEVASVEGLPEEAVQAIVAAANSGWLKSQEQATLELADKMLALQAILDRKKTEPLPDGALKPCPFCGGTDLAVTCNYVECGSCGTEGPTAADEVPSTEMATEARRLWNTRAVRP